MTPDEAALMRREEARHCPCGLLASACDEHADGWDDEAEDDEMGWRQW